MFSSLQEVWQQYPSGGQTGDYLNVNGRIYYWDSTADNWVCYSQPKPSARTAQVFNGDVHVANNLTIGGTLNARLVVGRDAFCGLYATATALNTFCPNPLAGQWALVMIANREADSLALGEVYYCATDGTWTDAGYQSDVAGIIGQLQAESTARQTADQELQENLDDAIAQEVTDRNAAITAAISEEVVNRNAAIDAKDYAVITNEEMDAVLPD